MKKSIVRKGSVLTDLLALLVIAIVIVSLLMPRLKNNVSKSKIAHACNQLASLQSCNEVFGISEIEEE